MGIIKAVSASVDAMAADQWKEFFICDALPADEIMVRGRRRVSETSANHGDPEVITDGSIIAVADGQCAIVVSGGKVVSVLAEPGENIFHSTESAGIFSGASVKKLGSELGRRISFGGDAPPVRQRVYYLNTKEIMGIPFGDDQKIPFRIVDEERGLDVDCTLLVSGKYSFRITDPEKIYKQVIGNTQGTYKIGYLVSHMKTEVHTLLREAVGKVCHGSYRPSEIPALMPEIRDEVASCMNETLRRTRGIEIVSLGFDTFSLTETASGRIRDIQLTAVYKDPGMAAALISEATADAMVSAAQNTGGTRAVMLARFCPECGAKTDGDSFCRECGHSLKI